MYATTIEDYSHSVSYLFHAGLNHTQRATMYDILADYHPDEFGVADYFDLRERLRRARVPFKNRELRYMMLELGFPVP